MKQLFWIAIIFVVVLAYVIFLSNSPQSPGDDQAQTIVDRAISVHGGSTYDPVEIRFTFRDKKYVGKRYGAKFQFERHFVDKEGNQVSDVLTNAKLTRTVNGELVKLSSKDSNNYANSVNSVLYFALLPYPLNDPAVHKSYLGIVDLKGQNYHKVKVTFSEEGGGDDFDDTYIYWFNEKTGEIDYLAYDYHTNGGGIRFREASKKQSVGGITFVDYINHKANLQRSKVETTDQDFLKGQLEKLSEIRLENIEVLSLTEDF